MTTFDRSPNATEATGEHFNLPGHSHKDMKFRIIEEVKSFNAIYARKREKLSIKN